MNRMRILRDVFLIFAMAFVVLMTITTIADPEISNETVIQVIFVALCYAVAALLFFWESITEKIGYLPIEIFYVLLLNVMYIIFAKIFTWEYSVQGYLINFISSIILYLCIKLIIFTIDILQAAEINDIIKRRRSMEEKR